MACYSCLQLLPTTEFFADQVPPARRSVRKRATQHWCKPCGLKYGKILHGKWFREVVYNEYQEVLFRPVMGGELDVKKCVVCTSKRQYTVRDVYWGCVDCFKKKEEKRLDAGI